MSRDSHAQTTMLTLVIGVALSTVLGVFFYFRTDLNAALASFAGLIGTTITLQVESLLRARQVREQATRHQRLIANMETAPWIPELLDRSLSAHSTITQTYGSTIALDLARKTFEDCQAQLEGLARGFYSTADPDESPNSPVLKLTERMRTSLLATSAGGDLDWWLAASGTRTYWRLNQEALRRGVTIKRIFIYRTWPDELDALAKAQQACGVQVLRVDENQLPPTLRLNLMIWDGVYGLEPKYNSSGEWVNTSFTFAAQDVALLLDRFKLIESCAEPWPNTTAP
jgi:hypothetical protein